MCLGYLILERSNSSILVVFFKPSVTFDAKSNTPTTGFVNALIYYN